jgi:uncharacterized membrane protein YoaK (UPF0700 family)
MPLLWARRRRQIMSVGLTATAGFIDAICYMILFHIYTANMSGNSITFGTEAAYGRWHVAFHAALPIASFIAGLCLCTFLMELMTRARWRTRLAVVLGLEASCLAAFLIVGAATLGWDYPGRLPDLRVFTLLTILAAGAMGLQNASLTHVGSLTVTTTHVTGTLLKFAEGFMHHLFWFYDHTLGRFPRRWGVVLRVSPRKHACQAACLMGLMWISYVIGAVLGALWLAHEGLSALMGPISVVCLFILLDLIWPACVTGLRHVRVQKSPLLKPHV